LAFGGLWPAVPGWHAFAVDGWTLCGEQSLCPPGAAVGTGEGFGVAGAGFGVGAGVGPDGGRVTTPMPGAWGATGVWVDPLTGVGSAVGAVVGGDDGVLDGVVAGEDVTGEAEAAGRSLAPVVGSADGAGLPGPGARDDGPAVGTTAIWDG
jgi:hypothetical protein